MGIRAATVVVQDNVDEFINDLRRQGRLAAWAAVINAVVAIAAVGAEMWAIDVGA